MSNRRRSLLIIDDEEERVEEEHLQERGEERVEEREVNPFSFRRFILSQNQTSTLGETESQSAPCWEGEEPAEEVAVAGLPVSKEEEDDDNMRRGGRGRWKNEGEEETSDTLLYNTERQNVCLRRTVTELEKKCREQEVRVQQLVQELASRRRREEKELKDLEEITHSVEHNLQLMTKRAVKAENTVSRLHSQLQQLQVQHSAAVRSMQQSACLAAESLSRATGKAECAVRQLLGETGSLRAASQFLKSIDRFSCDLGSAAQV